MIRIVLVDDHLMFRTTTRLILSAQPDMVVVGEAGNGAEALDVVAHAQPDVVLMDVEMPILDGIAATRQLHAADPTLVIVLVTSYDHDTCVHEGLHVGAVGYLRKTMPQELLLTTIRAAVQARAEGSGYAARDEQPGEQR